MLIRCGYSLIPCVGSFGDVPLTLAKGLQIQNLIQTNCNLKIYFFIFLLCDYIRVFPPFFSKYIFYQYHNFGQTIHIISPQILIKNFMDFFQNQFLKIWKNVLAFLFNFFYKDKLDILYENRSWGAHI